MTQVRPALIGFLHGHLSVEYEGMIVNSGIALVVPVRAIGDTLQDPALVAERGRLEAAVQKPPAARPDSAE